MIRVIRTVIGALVLALCAAPGASAGTQAHATTIVHVHVYDSHDHAVAATPSTGERGPPSLYDYNATLYGAVDRRSHGASARPDGTTPRPTYDYAHHAQLALVAQAAGTTGEPDRARVGDLSSLASGGVAANSVRPAVTDARLGRALADDFRGRPNPVGDGSALDAARHTVDTGDLVGGSTHLEKAVEMRDRYARILRRGGLSTGDQAAAQGRYDAYSSFVIENDLDAMMRARGLR